MWICLPEWSVNNKHLLSDMTVVDMHYYQPLADVNRILVYMYMWRIYTFSRNYVFLNADATGDSHLTTLLRHMFMKLT